MPSRMLSSSCGMVVAPSRATWSIAPSGAIAASCQAAATGFADRAGGRLIQSLSISSRRGGQTAVVAVRGRSLSLLPGFDGFAIEQVAALPVEKVSG